MVALIAAVVAAVAVSPSPSSTPSPVPEIAHVVTSDRGAESAARTARTTYVVTSADIARDGDRTVADALENVPGISIVQYGGFGSRAQVSVRGSSPDQVLVLMDGLPVAGSQIENIDLGQLAVAGISRIEIVEGGGSTLYGSGSIGGVINIITTGQPQRTNATVSTGSFGQQTYQFQTPYLTFQRTYATNDYSVVNGSNRQNAQAGLTSINARYGHTIGAFDLTFSGDVSNALLGTPNALDSFSPTSEQNTVDRDLRLSLDHRGARSTASLQLGDSSQNLSFTCDTPVDGNCPNAYPTPPPNMTNPPYTQMLYDQHWMASLRNVVGDQRERLVYGIDLMRGIARIDPGTDSGVITFDPYAQTAGYVQSQWFSTNGDEIYAGLRGERDGGFGGAYSPSIGGIVYITPSVELKLNAATAFRAPTAEDLYYPGFSNPDLQPERTQVGDATLVVPSILGGVSLGWFTTHGSDLIALNQNFIPENIQHALIQGFTFTARTRPFRGLVATLDETNLYKEQDLGANARIEGQGPVFSVTPGLEYIAPPASRFDGFKITATTQGPQETNDPYLSPIYAVYQPSTFTNVSAYVGYRVTPQLVLALRGYNLGNDRYAIYAGYPMPGRSFAVELRTR